MNVNGAFVRYFALARGDDAGTIGAYETGLVLRFEDLGDSGHVMLWNPFSDCHNKRNLSSNSLHMSISEHEERAYIKNCLRSQWRRHENSSGIR
jgi:hypothetical protein